MEKQLVYNVMHLLLCLKLFTLDKKDIKSNKHMNLWSTLRGYFPNGLTCGSLTKTLQRFEQINENDHDFNMVLVLTNIWFKTKFTCLHS